MHKFLLVTLVILSLAATSANSQSIQRENLKGAWVCVEATIPDNLEISPEEMEAMDVLKSAIVKSKFLFNPNGLFEWQFPKGIPAVFQGLDFLNNQKWSIDANESLIYIGDPKENLMQIMVRQKAGTIYFILSDTPLLLRMNKE